ncbi:MAG: YheU family protein [Planctomycetia bacterium]|nr:YheU family protein [Planctomycetia bacterium]
MVIPHAQLSAAALRAVVEEFVTRDGTDHSSVAGRIETVLRQLAVGRVELHFDDQSQTCNILAVQGGSHPRSGERGS